MRRTSQWLRGSGGLLGVLMLITGAMAGGPSGSPGTSPGAGDGSPKPARAATARRSDRDPEPTAPRDPIPVSRAQELRKAALEQLKALDGHPRDGTPEPNAAPGRRVVLEERVRWLNAWLQEQDERRKVERLQAELDRRARELKTEREQVQALWDQSEKRPACLLPESFQHPLPRLSDAVLTEMKDAIESARNELKERAATLDASRADPKRAAGSLAELRSERDQAHQRATALAAQRPERPPPIAAAATGEARSLAQEKLVNWEWESRAAAEHVKTVEARIELQAKRSAVAELEAQVLDARTKLSQRTLELMQGRYQALVDRRQQDLTRAAARAQSRADTTVDPLERIRAKHTVEALELQALVLRDEQALATNATLSPQEQTALADRAEADLAHLKQVVDERRGSALVALRLNNEFRRLSSRRDAVVRNELARAANQLTHYENALTEVELELLNESEDDRFELESLLETLPAKSRPAAVALFEEFEAKRRTLLFQRREVLEQLVARIDEAHKQILRRVRTLDAQYAFIRTHIFWVRDAEPISADTLVEGQHESRRVAQALFRVASEPWDRSLWRGISAEFVVSLLIAVGLPWPLHRARKTLIKRLSAGSNGTGASDRKGGR